MAINVIGLGYIGLPTALMLAAHGNEVVGTDYNKELVATLVGGKTTFKEDGIEELFAQAVASGISFSSEYQCCDTYIVSVPTPYDKATKKIDPCYVCAAVDTIMDVAPAGATIVIESTISPGTIDRFVRPIIGKKDQVINLVHAPERILPGNMLFELQHNNRTIGADDPSIGEQIKSLYASFCLGEITVTDIRTAEMTKVVENTFRDINIAFANELQKICRLDGMDVHEIIRIANMHPRVNILQPGPGVGGHCISVDPWFLVGDYPEDARLIRTAREINDSMPAFVLERAKQIADENGIADFSKVGIFGLTYKANVDDIRESPTLQLLSIMSNNGEKGICKVFDPWVERDVVPNQCYDMSSFLDGLDMVILMVGHSQVAGNVDVFGKRIVLDCCNVLGKGENIYKI